MTIYKITNLINGKIYIGKSAKKTAKRRWIGHVRDSVHGDSNKRHFHNAIKKYGPENFSVTTLHSRIRTEKRLNILEKRYIKKFKSNDRRYGYNLTEGGEGVSGWKQPRENVEKHNKLLQRVMVGNKNGIGNQNAKGMKHTLASRRKMSISHRNRPPATLTYRKNMSRAQRKSWRDGNNPGFTNLKHSRRTRKKMSKAAKIVWKKRKDGQTI